MPRSAIQSQEPNHNQPLLQLPLVGYVRIRQLIPGIIPVSKATLYRMIRRGAFPAPVKISENISAWEVSRVRAFLEANKSPEAEGETK